MGLSKNCRASQKLSPTLVEPNGVKWRQTRRHSTVLLLQFSTVPFAVCWVKWVWAPWRSGNAPLPGIMIPCRSYEKKSDFAGPSYCTGVLYKYRVIEQVRLILGVALCLWPSHSHTHTVGISENLSCYGVQGGVDYVFLVVSTSFGVAFVSSLCTFRCPMP